MHFLPNQFVYGYPQPLFFNAWTSKIASNPNSQLLKTIEHYYFSVNDQIGNGYSSVVYKGKNQNNEHSVAIKVINLHSLPSRFHRQLLENELQILRKVQSEHIIEVFDIFQTLNNTYIITEYCDSGDLSSFLKQKKKLNE